MFIDITQPLMSEISPTSFSLRKNGHLRKRNKAELASETKKLISKDQTPTTLPFLKYNRVIIIDFIAYARKVSLKKKPPTDFLILYI